VSAADEVVEVGARAAALFGDYDGCFERLDGTDPDGEEPMSTDREDADFWLTRTHAALRAAWPILSSPIRRVASGQAAAARARGDADEERRWLDLLAVLDQQEKGLGL